MVKKIHQINQTARLRLKDWGYLKDVIVLQKKKRFLFFSYWIDIDFNFPDVVNKYYKSIEEISKSMMDENATHFNNKSIKDVLGW